MITISSPASSLRSCRDVRTLWVRLSSAGPSELALRIAGLVRGYSINQIEGSANVIGGQTYEVSVALHYAMDGNIDQLFELTTKLDP